MPRLKKENRIVDVKEEFVEGYLSRGYDLIDIDGNVEKHATGGRSISLPDYNKVVEELADAQTKIQELESDSKVVELENQLAESKKEIKNLKTTITKMEKEAGKSETGE